MDVPVEYRQTVNPVPQQKQELRSFYRGNNFLNDRSKRKELPPAT